MKSVGLFEAKTKFSALCEEVVEQGEALLITRRGTPWVKLVPAAVEAEETAWDRREALLKQRGPWKKELEFESLESGNPPVWVD